MHLALCQLFSSQSPLALSTHLMEIPSWAGRHREPAADLTCGTPTRTRPLSSSTNSTRWLRPRNCSTSWRRRNCRWVFLCEGLALRAHHITRGCFHLSARHFSLTQPMKWLQQNNSNPHLTSYITWTSLLSSHSQMTSIFRKFIYTSPLPLSCSCWDIGHVCTVHTLPCWLSVSAAGAQVVSSA